MNDYKDILFTYAYNILGSVEDARDAVQDVLYNFLSTPREGIDNEHAYLVRAVVNQAINIRNRRNRIVLGEVWLPEPFSTEEADTDINLREILSYSMLVLLEQLNPKERAVFILKEGFSYSHEEIAEVLSTTVENSRKLLSRAKARLDGANLAAQPAAQKNDHKALLENYINAIRGRDTKALEGLLSAEVIYHADGGEKLKVVKKICRGSEEVAALLIYIYEKFQKTFTVTYSLINHQPAILFSKAGKLLSCLVLGISPEDGKIFQIDNILDRSKLKDLASER